MAAGIDIITFGCRLNAWESEVMRAHAKELQGFATRWWSTPVP
jgi:tRNA A37 methylthiotransferase MiaB